MPDVLAAVRSASVCEVAWQETSGRLRVRGAVPLVSPAGPVLAFPYSDAGVARSIAAAPEVLLTLTEPRSTGTAFESLMLRCTPALSEDRQGDRFAADLLDQELRKYPPSRTLADSPLLRREHWWWLPRMIVDLTVTGTSSHAPRSLPDQHLLVVGSGAGLGTAIARVRRTDPLEVDVVEGTLAPGPAVLFGQDLSFPDLERWSQWSWHGAWDGVGFEATQVPERVGLPPPLGVLARWRRQRDLERRCRAALR